MNWNNQCPFCNFVRSMEQEIKKVLLKYWGYSTFRPLQEDIIKSILDNNDTLALLPTGGGKSICFQIPALVKEGVCIVITPLIALMKDQVENLKKKGIKAAAIYSGMHFNEVEMALDNASYGDLKFLYISPERLETNAFRSRLEQMPVSILAVDEAHCISQWGYDFRPPYLKIAEVRGLLPGVPIIALTATATLRVVEDIQDKLLLKKKNVFQKSFERKNLVYWVINSEDKYGQIVRILRKSPGIGIIYVRNRNKTKQIAEYLKKQKISADFYHAGLNPKTRDYKQNQWMQEKTRIMIATNAFGMGIDKPNVRIVIHVDIPDNIEAYFQEAGRAGRDEKTSYSFLIFDEADIINTRKNFQKSFPPIEKIKSVYQSLGNYFQLATGSGKDLSFDFNIREFSEVYKFSPIIAYSALKFLEKEGYILLNESFSTQSKIHFQLTHADLYRFQVETPRYDAFIKLLLRLYSGLFNDFTPINEKEIARNANKKDKDIIQYLEYLNKLDVLTYIHAKSDPQITFIKERLDPKNIHITKEHYQDRKKSSLNRLESIINYAIKSDRCRSQSLISYFGEKNPPRCGVCDICKKINRLGISDLEFNEITMQLNIMLESSPQSLQEIVFDFKGFHESKIVKVLRWLQEQNKIYINKNQQYCLRKQFKLF